MGTSNRHISAVHSHRAPAMLLVVGTLVAIQAMSAALAAIAPCTGGYLTRSQFRLEAGTAGVVVDNVNFCAPAERSVTHTDGTSVAIGVSSANMGVAAAAGTLSPEPFNLSRASAAADNSIEFTLVKVDQSLPDFVFMPIGYLAELVTLQNFVSLTSPATATVGGRGFVNVFQFDNSGATVRAGGVPLEHRNGVPAAQGVGSSVFLSADAVTLEVGRLSFITFQANAQVQTTASANLGQNGSAGASFALALSLGLIAPDGYAFEFTEGVAPEIGIFPHIEAPFVPIPIPAAVWLFSGGLFLVRRNVSRPRAA